MQIERQTFPHPSNVLPPTGEAKLGIRAITTAIGNEIANDVGPFRAFRTQLRDAFGDFQGPYVSIDDINKFMMAHDLPNCPITTSDGRLVGLIRRDDVARATPP